MPISAKILTSRLLGIKTVKVLNGEKKEEEFDIQKVMVEKFAGELTKIENAEKYVGKSKKDIEKEIMDNMSKKQVSDVMRPVLISGVISPNVVEKALDQCGENEIPVNVLLLDIDLCVNLYLEIVKISLPQK